MNLPQPDRSVSRPLPHRRVVVTGYGLVTPLAWGVSEVARRIHAGEHAFTELTEVHPDRAGTRWGSEFKNFPVREVVKDRRILRMVQRSVPFGLAAAEEAVKMSGLTFPYTRSEDVAVYVAGDDPAVDLAGFSRAIARSLGEDGHVDMNAFGRDGHHLFEPFFLLKMLPNNLACYISIAYGARGSNGVPVMSAAAGLQSVGTAYQCIQDGFAEVAFCGSGSSLILPGLLHKYSDLGFFYQAGPEPVAPFDRRRQGFIPAEGGAILILEAHDAAVARGAQILGELRGYGCSTDAYDIFRPDPEGGGATRAIRDALTTAGIEAEDLDLLTLHGQSTLQGDRSEAAGVRAAFGEATEKIPAMAVKSSLGHLGAAAGAADLILGLQALETGRVPPTRNYQQPDPSCGMNLSCEARSLEGGRGGTGLTLSRGIGGQSAAIVYQRTSAVR